MNRLCIIQARMGSSRLPGKVMMPLAGKEVVFHVYQRVRKCKLIDAVVVATSDLKKDDLLVDYCSARKWPIYRGSETDVLARFTGAAEEFSAKTIIRVTCDCPLIDPKILTHLIETFESSNCDYASTNFPKRTYPVGVDCEIMTIKALRTANKFATSSYDREHVTPYIYNHPELFLLKGLENAHDQSHIRITLDTQEDYSLLSRIYDKCYRSNRLVDLRDAISFCEDEIKLSSRGS